MLGTHGNFQSHFPNFLRYRELTLCLPARCSMALKAGGGGGGGGALGGERWVGAGNHMHSFLEGKVFTSFSERNLS